MCQLLLSQYNRIAKWCIAVAIVALFLVDLRLGAYTLSTQQVADILLHGPTSHQSLAQQVIWQLRLPHVTAVVLIGSAFALAGAVMQGLFRNPLADPTLLGVSTGAQLALLLVWLVWPVLQSWLLITPFFAFIGGIMSMAILYLLAHHVRYSGFGGLLLAGVALSAFFAAVSALLLLHLNTDQLRSALFWGFGGVIQTNWWVLLVGFVLIICGALLLRRQADAFDVLSMGEQDAQATGVNLVVLKRHTVVGVAILIAPAVAIAGPIAFVGLIVPHIVRMLFGPMHKRLMWYCVAVGMLLMLLTDILCRLPIWHQILPMGVVTALYGAPFFIWLLYRQQRCAL